MQVIYERCCGLDVHQKTVVACVLTPAGQATRTFGTMTGDLLALADGLVERGVTHVAMESTGVFWKPIHNLREGSGLTLLVVNAQPMKAVPGRKTDVRDAAWIADRLRHGLLRGSFIPDHPQRERRELVRYRRSLIPQRSQVSNRLQKVLEGANIKLSAVASDIVGVSGRAMQTALAGGTADPAALASLARGRLHAKRAVLEQALQGLMGPHQRLVLQSQLRHLDFLADEIVRLDEEVATRMPPHAEARARLDAIPGVGRRGAEEVLAAIGPDRGRFPTAAHLASWARIFPGNHERAGKRKHGRTGGGNPWLRRALVEAARGAAHTQTSYLAAQDRRLAARRGANRAALAVAPTILVIISYLLRDHTTYQDRGPTSVAERDRAAVVRRAVHRLTQLGYKVTIEAA